MKLVLLPPVRGTDGEFYEIRVAPRQYCTPWLALDSTATDSILLKRAHRDERKKIEKVFADDLLAALKEFGALPESSVVRLQLDRGALRCYMPWSSPEIEQRTHSRLVLNPRKVHLAPVHVTQPQSFVAAVAPCHVALEYGFAPTSLALACCDFVAERKQEFSLEFLPDELAVTVQAIRDKVGRQTAPCSLAEESDGRPRTVWECVLRDWPVTLPLFLWTAAEEACEIYFLAVPT